MCCEPSSTLKVMCLKRVRRGRIDVVGVVFDDVFLQMRANALELIGSYIQRLERSAQRFPHGQSSFYSLYRIDFLLDRNLKPWITEV